MLIEHNRVHKFFRGLTFAFCCTIEKINALGCSFLYIVDHVGSIEGIHYEAYGGKNMRSHFQGSLDGS